MKKRTLILCGLLLSISLLAGCQKQEEAVADQTQDISDISADEVHEEDGQVSDTDTVSDDTEAAETEESETSDESEPVRIIRKRLGRSTAILRSRRKPCFPIVMNIMSGQKRIIRPDWTSHRKMEQRNRQKLISVITAAPIIR